jgi:hypothetical protein
MNVPKRDIKCGGGKASVGADKEGREAEEVSGGDERGIVHIDFKWCNSWESQGCLEELMFGDELN